MKSLWNDDQARPFLDDPLALRVYTSRLLGRDPDLVLHGGGNTSVKATAKDLFGDPVEVLYVKGSGWDLATIEAPGFAPVRLDVLRRMAELERLNDSDMVSGQRAAMLDPRGPNPSVEAILHAVIPFRFVDHTHADAVVTLTNTPDGESRVRELYGPDMLIVPYVMPGFVLARTIFEMTRDVDWQALDGMILLSHGVFTFDDEARASYEKMIAIADRAERAITEAIGPSASSGVEPAPADEPEIDLVALADLRRRVSGLRGQPMLAELDTSPASLAFSRRSDVADVATRGPLTPDHVIRTKRTAAILDDDPQAGLEAFAADQDRAFFQHASSQQASSQQDEDDLTQLDRAPRWAVWRGRGTLAFGRTPKEVGIVADIKEHTLKAIRQAEALGGWTALPEKDIFEIEYWELEQAKLKKGGSSPELQGQIALVTGAASGIGHATVEALVERGAVVAAVDVAPEIETRFEGDASVQPIRADVTDDQALDGAVHEAVRRWGGLDLLVLCAGAFPASALIEDLDPETWRSSLELNLTSQQRLLQLAVPFLRRGLSPAVVVVASKNVPAPGPGAAAYSVAKAGLTQLARVAALELAGDGVRVNLLHPDAVFDTGVWTEEVLRQRAEHYGMTVEEYRRKNLLGVEITSHDVARLICAMAGPLFSKTTGAQVPIDGGNERVI